LRVKDSYFQSPKAGSSDDEYEDAYDRDFPDGEELVRHELRFAVADGATESYLSRDWAQCLVRGFCRTSGVRLDKVLAEALACWKLSLARYEESRAEIGRPMQWYEEAKLSQGAHATFLGLQFREVRGNDRRGRWQAVAIGDTCLFQVRREKLTKAFPLERAEDFNSTPSLVPSRPIRPGAVPNLTQRAVGTWESGDEFYLATDALSAWFLARYERQEAPWRTLRNLDPDQPPEFANWVNSLRSDHLMRNDDVTLVRIEVA
jgi:hypothetical protein